MGRHVVMRVHDLLCLGWFFPSIFSLSFSGQFNEERASKEDSILLPVFDSSVRSATRQSRYCLGEKLKTNFSRTQCRQECITGLSDMSLVNQRNVSYCLLFMRKRAFRYGRLIPESMLFHDDGNGKHF